MAIKRILEGLNHFQNDYFASHQDLFEQLSHGQSPEILFITCSDSRINPNLLTHTEPGELFIIRNLGNIIPPHGSLNSSEGAGIEYAVCSLNIKHIIVCGHSNCGSMKGLLQLQSINDEMPLVYDWLKHYAESTRRILRDNYRDFDYEEKLRIAIETNILNQIENIETYPAIRAKLHVKQLNLHAWMYEIETGKIFAYNASKSQFVPLNLEPFPVPAPLSVLNH